MKELHGAASAQVSASVGECFALVEAIEEYPSWYPENVKQVYVVERSHDGRPLAARAQLHVSYGPLVRDFDLLLAVAAEPPDHVKLTRVPHEASDPERFEVMWKITPGRIDLDLRREPVDAAPAAGRRDRRGHGPGVRGRGGSGAQPQPVMPPSSGITVPVR